MFCPQCKAEYRQGYTRCSDCGVPLVSVLPDSEEEPAPDHETPVEIFSASDTFEAETVKGLLEANGIKVVFSSGELIPGLPGAVSLSVDGEHAELAEKLIEEYRTNLPDDRNEPLPSSED